ncbi:MAG: hypothetical protein KA791_03160, partial [Flavobacteriales bacterium]|nr:hypothetical protein [Flavobacteriales bacterium]
DFFGATFHQDWKLEASSPEDAIELFRQDANKEELWRLAQRIETELIGSQLSDDELSDHLYSEFGSHYYAKGAGLFTREWLAKVVDQLRAVR